MGGFTIERKIMKQINKKKFYALSILFTALFLLPISVKAEESVVSGIEVEGTSVAGLSEVELKKTLETLVDEKLQTEVELIYSVHEEPITTTLGDLGAYWESDDLIHAIMNFGQEGNVVDRYKEIKDLENESINIRIDLAYDTDVMATFFSENASIYDTEAINSHLVKTETGFDIVGGEEGRYLDVDASVEEIAEVLTTDWDGSDVQLELTVKSLQALGSYEELQRVTDLMGSFSTSFAGTTYAKTTNVTNGANLINGITLYPGEELSFTEYVTPYTRDNGYEVGIAYSAGKSVESIGGGICQVSSTLYNAAIRAELEITQRQNHSMVVGYVPLATDATLAESSGIDLKIKNNYDFPIYIETYVTDEKRLYANIYGEEYRDANRTVEYETKVLQTIPAPADVIIADGGQGVGYIDVDSGYTGYKTELWKIVYVDGVEESREKVNTSNYRAVAREVRVGVNTASPEHAAQINAAIATGDVNHIKSVAATLLAAEQQGQVVQPQPVVEQTP